MFPGSAKSWTFKMASILAHSALGPGATGLHDRELLHLRWQERDQTGPRRGCRSAWDVGATEIDRDRGRSGRCGIREVTGSHGSSKLSTFFGGVHNFDIFPLISPLIFTIDFPIDFTMFPPFVGSILKPTFDDLVKLAKFKCQSLSTEGGQFHKLP